MREFLETIEDQLRRLAAEGNDSVPLDDESDIKADGIFGFRFFCKGGAFARRIAQ